MKRRIILILCLFGLAAIGYQLVNSPAGDSSHKQIVNIPEGASLREVSHLLADKHLVRNPTLFEWMGRLVGADRKVISGEYEFHAGMPPTDILSRLRHGQVVLHAVTIPEGYTIAEIASLLEEKNLAQRSTFLQQTRNPTLIASLGLQNHSLEGYLFPDTYFLTKQMKSQDMIRTFVHRLQENLTDEFKKRAVELNMTIHEVLTLASVIEKETGLAEERRLISGVFHNRLKKNIPLQSDPTVIYSLEIFDGNITKRDLAINSPYNTYRVKGLPPGPIANPGAASIQAALYPAQTPYLYFVSRNDGSHEFSSTLAEHNMAVQKYQLGGTRRAS